MQVALICPPHLLSKYAEQRKYHLVLPHLFRNTKYLDFYQKKDDSFIILDNGAAEGLTYGHRHLLTLGEQVGASEIVVPDIMGDAEGTLAEAQKFARFAQPEFQYMFVLQGNTPAEVQKCLFNLDNGNMFSYVTTIGIPRHFYNMAKWFRIQLAAFLAENQFHLRYEIHFLGANAWTKEVLLLADIVQDAGEGFRGIDTSTPIYMGLEREDINMVTEETYRSRPNNYFERTDDNEDLIYRNIETYDAWARNN